MEKQQMAVILYIKVGTQFPIICFMLSPNLLSCIGGMKALESRRSERWEKRHRTILWDVYGCGWERWCLGKEGGKRQKVGEKLEGREGWVWGKGETVRCFPNSSFEFIVWKTCGLNLFWGERRTRSHSSALHKDTLRTHRVHLYQSVKSCSA